MSFASRPVPHVGMDVVVLHLGIAEPATIEEIRDEGRTLVVRGQTFSLRRLTGHFVLDGEPYYGTRVSLDADASREPTTD